MNKMFGALLALISVIWVNSPLNCLNIVLTNNPSDIFASQKVCLRFNFDNQDEAVYKDSIRFSVDTPGIELKNWRSSVSPVSQYSKSFKRTKKMYTDSFNAEINLGFDVGFTFQHLRDTNLYVACFLLDKNNKNKPKNFVQPLNYFGALPDASFTISGTMQDNIVTLSNKIPFVLQKVSDNNAKLSDLYQENVLFDRLSALWLGFLDWIKHNIKSVLFIKIYLIFFVIFLLFFLRKRYRFMRYLIPVNEAWQHEIKIFIAFMFLAINCYFLRFWFDRYLIYEFLAGLCLLGSFYYLRQMRDSETFLGKLKILFGIILAILIIPLLLKAFLLKNGAF